MSPERPGRFHWPSALDLLDGYERRDVSGFCLAVAVRNGPYDRAYDRGSLVYSVRPDRRQVPDVIVNPPLPTDISGALETEGEGVAVRVSSRLIQAPALASQTTGETPILRLVQYERSRTEPEVVEFPRRIRIVMKASVGPTANEGVTSCHLVSLLWIFASRATR